MSSNRLASTASIESSVKARRRKEREDQSDGKPECTLETIKPGDCAHYPKEGDTVRIHYNAYLLTGEKFDSSRDRGKPIEFKLGQSQVIIGWEDNISKLSRGQIARLTIPHELAYGQTGFPPV